METTFDPKLTRKYQHARADFYVQLASLALLYYDYLLTLPFEIKYIWTAPRKVSSFLYFCCRYALVANLIWMLAKVGEDEVGLGGIKFHERGLSCGTVAIISSTFSLFGHVAILSVWGLRTHALCGRNKIISALLGFLAGSIIALFLAKLVYIGTLFGRGAYSGCADPPGIAKIGILTGVLVLLFEILAFGIASHHAWVSLRADTKFWSNPRASLHYVVFSEGLLYLTAVLALTIVTAVCNLQVWGGFARPLNSLKLPLSCILTARFLLRLRHYHHVTSSRRETDSSDSTRFSTGFYDSHRRSRTQGIFTEGESAGRMSFYASEGERSKYAYEGGRGTEQTVEISTTLGSGYSQGDYEGDIDGGTRRGRREMEDDANMHRPFESSGQGERLGGGSERLTNHQRRWRFWNPRGVVHELGANVGPTRDEVAEEAINLASRDRRG